MYRQTRRNILLTLKYIITMAANIEIRTIGGKEIASFAENGKKERAWHGLGDDQQIFDRPMFVAEALKACHADYRVSLQPVVTISPEIESLIASGEMIDPEMLKALIVSDKKATMRLDTNEILGVTSDKYGIVQNEDAFKFVDMLCSGQFAERDNTPVIETCGVLGKGERVFVTAKFPKQIVLDAKRDDLMDMYVVITTSHDGTGAVRCVVTGVRCVCNNTLQLALSNNIGRISFRHSSKVMERMDLLNAENSKFAYNTLHLAEIYTNSLKESYDYLRSVKISEKQMDNILAEVILTDENKKEWDKTHNIESDAISQRSRNIFYEMKNTIENGIGQNILETGNAQWVLNGVTTYFQNVANYKDKTTKFDSIFDGNTFKKVQKTYDLLLAA